MGIYQYKPEAQASAETTHQSIPALTRLRFGRVLVRNYLPLALHGDSCKRERLAHRLLAQARESPVPNCWAQNWRALGSLKIQADWSETKNDRQK